MGYTKVWSRNSPIVIVHLKEAKVITYYLMLSLVSPTKNFKYVTNASNVWTKYQMKKNHFPKIEKRNLLDYNKCYVRPRKTYSFDWQKISTPKGFFKTLFMHLLWINMSYEPYLDGLLVNDRRTLNLITNNMMIH